MKRSLRYATAALALTLAGCELTGVTFTYSDGDQSISGTAHFQQTGKRVVPSK